MKIKNKSAEAKIGDFLNSMGIPVVGITTTCQHPSVPEDFSPRGTLKTAKAIICYGVPIPKGIICADSDSLALYWRYCNMMYRALDTASNQLCLILEEKGYSASPIYSCFPWKAVGREFWGLLPLVYWAEEAGLGKLTRCGLLGNPIYGTRMLLGGVITAMGLEPTEKLSDEPCPPGCLDCIDACPVHAIGKTGKVDHNSCIRYSGANPLLAHLLKDPEVKEKFSFETMLNTVGVDDHGSYTCFNCLRVCPLNK